MVLMQHTLPALASGIADVKDFPDYRCSSSFSYGMAS